MMHGQGTTRLKFLGRGAGFLPSEGNTSAYLKHGTILYLFDCGETVFSKLLEKNILDGVTEIHVFITHLHSDHIGSLGTLLLYCQFKLTIKMSVYSYSDNLDTILRSQEITNYTFINLKDHRQYEYLIVNNDFSILYNLTYHAGVLAVSYTFYHNGDIVFYSGDTALRSNSWINILLYQEQACAFYIDTALDGSPEAHVSIHQLAEYFPEEERHKVWCMHLDNLDVIEICKVYGFNVVEVD